MLKSFWQLVAAIVFVLSALQRSGVVAVLLWIIAAIFWVATAINVVGYWMIYKVNKNKGDR
jgi:hypothetical protein